MPYSKMNPRIKKLWVDALRSGEYNQCTGVLKSTVQPNSFCCLGVLCDVYGKNVLKKKSKWIEGGFPFKGKINTTFLNESLLERVGISKKCQQTFIRMNDSIGSSFEDIARFIVKNL